MVQRGENSCFLPGLSWNFDPDTFWRVSYEMGWNKSDYSPYYNWLFLLGFTCYSVFQTIIYLLIICFRYRFVYVCRRTSVPTMMTALGFNLERGRNHNPIYFLSISVVHWYSDDLFFSFFFVGIYFKQIERLLKHIFIKNLKHITHFFFLGEETRP